jgi:hypothetical protein
MGLIAASRNKRDSVLVGISIGLFSLGGMLILFWRGHPALVNYAYPAAALGMGLWFYSTRPALYLGFTWWVFFVTPFVRRLVDYWVGYFNPMSPVMLAPYLVAGVSILTVVNAAGKLARRAFLPFLLALLGVLYGYAIGVVKVGVMSATFGLLNWLLPVLLAIHVCLLTNLTREHEKVVLSTFSWGVLIMGVYGIWQYTAVPPWDAKWLLESGMWKTMGRPEVGGIRVFSTLNSTGPFAFVMTAGLLLLFSGRSMVSWFAAIPGYFSFLFTLVRSAWGGWFVGVAYLAWRSTGTLRKRLLLLLGLTAVLSIPLFVYAPNTDRASNRAETLTNLQDDHSFQSRLGLHIYGAGAFLSTPIGRGIGNYGTAAKLSKGEVRSFDSGVFAVLLTLGWFGSLLYVGGVCWLLFRLLMADGKRAPPFVTTLSAVVFAFMSMMLFLNQLNGVTGVIVWPLLGLASTVVRTRQSPSTNTAAV